MHALVKLVVSDVDGTLIYKGSYLNTARFPVMLKNLGDLNIPFCVATGRHYRELKKLFGNYCDTVLCVCCDGAYAVFANKLLFGIPVGTEAVKNFFDAFVGKTFRLNSIRRIQHIFWAVHRFSIQKKNPGFQKLRS